jgi:hypothetical protein
MTVAAFMANMKHVADGERAEATARMKLPCSFRVESGCSVQCLSIQQEISMRRAMIAAAIAVVGWTQVSLAQATQPASKQADVPVKAVVLFSSGVGYFEHFGTVQGDGSTQLLFKTQQINDILKSLVLQDMDGGKINTITYPSQDPIAKTLKSFQVDITANPSLGDLLNQLRGANVKITANASPVAGTILGVEKKQRPVGDKEHPQLAEVSVINILTGGMIRAVNLDDVEKIELEDAGLQAELHKALAALAQSRDQDKKPVAINFSGQGERHVRIGYVVEAPIWKTSYRLILSGAGAAASSKPSNDATTQPAMQDGKLQGWAIVENQTDNDWNNVQLSLVSGRPISFIQNLYQPLYIPRPIVQPELYASLTPQTYEGGMAAEKKVQQMKMSQQMAQRTRTAGRDEPAAFGAAVATTPAPVAGEDFERQLNAPMDAAKSVASAASASQIGELFEYTVGNVSLPRQKSAMIPIITDTIEIERVSIYNANVLPRNPLNGARLKNTTDKHLLQGPITVLDGSAYAGDARIDNVPPGQERLLSYGIDLQMLVDATKQEANSAIQSAKIVKGVLNLQRKNQSSREYVAENKSPAEKTLVIEHPRQPGWTLVEPQKPMETTDALYRFKGKVPAGEKSSLKVKEEIVTGEEVAILPCDLNVLIEYNKDGAIPKEVKDALAKAITDRQALVDFERQINEQNEKLKQITEQQTRIRENMKTVDKNSQYYNRLLGKLNDQESQIEKLQTDRDDLMQKRDDQRKQLEDYLKDLTVG